MPELLLYLLKVNVALVLFYLAYHVALRRLTFYHLNRLFLVFGIMFSTVYPFIDLSELLANHEPIANAYIVTIPAWAISTQTIVAAPTFDYWQLPVYLFWAGVIVMLIRFIVQLVSLYKIHAASEPANYKHIGFRQVKTIRQAFSFWQTIYLNPEQHKQDELEKILHHELIHITGWHTLDVLLAELSTVFYWFNPGAWLMKKAVKENLEFIADQNVVNTGVDKKEYQYLLLKVVGATQPQIANQFNFPSLKRRIAMMNKMPTSKAGKLRLLIALPLATTLLFAFRNAAPTINELSGELSKTSLELQGENDKFQEDQASFLERNPNVEQLYWLHEDVLDKTSKLTRVVIQRKDQPQFENYHLDNEKEIAAFEKKYGKLPPIPAQSLQQNGEKDLPKELVQHLKKNPAVKSVRGKVVNNRNAIVIGLKGGGTEVYYLDDAKSIAELERKYNLPELPPPPPPVPAAPAAPPAPPAPVQEVDLPAPPAPPVKPDTKDMLQSLPDGVVYYLDGKEDKTEAYKKLDPKKIHSINVIKGEQAQKIAGSKAAKGLISIVTEKNKDSKEVKELEQKFETLPAPPPPVRHEGPLVPASGAKLVEDEKTVTYVLWPNDVTKRELDAAQQAFAANGFDLSFKEHKDASGNDAINITIASRKLNNGTSVSHSLKGLAAHNNVVVVKGFKETGRFIVGTTIPPEK
ncbi:M56 family metallopeptidase [Pontibacter sp. Tf4]|uniref:M56 family metallopeptidase n=1 Tax=Pontibacter sp. Tf4 TaxID=2761620 RepID=UPI00162361BC|nr:M56 family metallopeptidase [Pontibacter sp. Tf4]MBB6611312.1 M56 family metallopeptidase [Pontibacter sp. Tf4]